jgi:hypothetical protein
MKLNGQLLTNSYRHPFSLPRVGDEPLAMQLQPLPLGFHQRLRERGIQPPTTPLKIARDSSGKPLRDGQGNALTLAETQNPEYLLELERYHQRVAVLALAQSLEGDQHVGFDTPVPSGTDGQVWIRYANALLHEMEAAGFTAGDLLLLCREISRISNLLDEQLTQAQANFSPSGPSPSG